MRNISISELEILCNTNNIRELIFATYNQDVTLDFNPVSYDLRFDKMIPIADDGRIILENSTARCSISISNITKITVDDNIPKTGIAICIHCCNSVNHSRIKNFWILAK